jgi:cellulose synthase/poly-beta-1,6-N-acetylglucosamine synthase-like glycosyltransferase
MFAVIAYYIYYFFAALVILQGFSSLRGGFRFLAYIKEQLAIPRSEFTPYVSIIAPCRGLDQGLRENLAALFQQDFPAYEIVFVTDHKKDPSLAVIESLRREFADLSSVKVQTVIAGPAENRGQKVHNLLAAVEQADPASDVLVFVDSDARPAVNWLRSLVAPLADESVGAATGYRWFIPEHGGLFSHIRSLWNASIASALGANREKNFCWGGATAIRRARFHKLKITEHWDGALSDDFAMTRALQAAHLPIHFVPQCLTVSEEDCGLREMLEFTTRQMKITRVYARHLWLTVLIGSLFFCIVFYTGLVTSILNAIYGGPFIVSGILVAMMFALGAGKSYVRLCALALALPAQRKGIWLGAWVHLLLWPVTSALYIYNCDEARRSRRITWRGITYELKSPTKTVIIR